MEGQVSMTFILGSTPLEWHERIFNYAKKKKILCFSTPFDINAVNSLSKLNVPAFKVASYELTYTFNCRNK